MEASAIHARTGLGRGRVTLPTPLLRLRSDQQLVGVFRGGNEDAFRVIHDRYRARLLAYVRQMLAGQHPDAEDVLQDVFVRAYAGLRANGRELSLRPWLYRIAHNRCVDELRRPMPPATESLELAPAATSDPVLASERRESLRRLIIDIRRLPDQQRSALLMREMSGMAYTEIAVVLGLSVPAVKSLLVRARMSLAAAVEARDTACHQIRSDLVDAHERGVRPSGLARRHLRDCSACREYRSELRGVRQLAALTPALGPLGILARLIGFGHGAGGGAAAGGTGSGVLAAGGAASAGTTVFGAAATHVAAVVAAAVVTAGGAVEIQRTVATQLDPAPAHHAKRASSVGQGTSVEGTVAASAAGPLSSSAPAPVQQAPASAAPAPQSPRAGPPKRSARVRKTVSAQPVSPPQPATDTAATTSAPASTDSTAPVANPPSCQSPAPAVQAPATGSDSTAASTPSTPTATSGTPASTSPDTSTESASCVSSNGTAGTTASSTPASASPSSTGPADSQDQNS